MLWEVLDIKSISPAQEHIACITNKNRATSHIVFTDNSYFKLYTSQVFFTTPFRGSKSDKHLTKRNRSHISFLNDLIEKLGIKLQAVKDADATKKAKTMAGIPSLSLKIGKLEGVIKKSYQEIGEAYYLTHATDPELEYARQFTQIREAKEEIIKLRAEIERKKAYDPAREREAAIVTIEEDKGE